jgi:hypothetical protein
MTSTGAVKAVLATLLAVGIGWLLRSESWERPAGMALEPARLALRTGESAPVDLVNRVRDITAVSFRLRFDAAIVAIEDAEPTHASIFEGGQAINLARRQEGGVVDVPGLAVAGGRTFEPGRPLLRFRITGKRSGSTTVVVENLRFVDGTEQIESLDVAPLSVVVGGGGPPTP